MNFFVHYFGCRANQAEIQNWIINLENAGYQLTDSIKNAEFAILNTCSVTEKAEKDVLRYISKIYKTTNLKWYIAGCTTSGNDNNLDQRYKNFTFLDNIKKKNIVDRIKNDFPVEGNIIYHSNFRSRIFLKVQNGCNFKCTFCIVPQLRGKSVSFPVTEIFKKAEYYSSLGYREIILTGINLSSYGYDLFPRQNLFELISKLSNIESLKLIRLSSLDPRYLNFDFVRDLSRIEKIALSFHFSFQSGSNTVLKRMKRSNKRVDYEKIISDFKNFFPDANYGADFIIGFPGETDAEFMETYDFIKSAGINYVHAFPFSPRKGTKAAEMDEINIRTMKKRVSEIKEVNKEIRLRYRERFRNRIVQGVVISEDDFNSVVVTSNYLTVKVPLRKGYKKRVVNVKITKIVNENLCEGTFVSE